MSPPIQSVGAVISPFSHGFCPTMFRNSAEPPQHHYTSNPLLYAVAGPSAGCAGCGGERVRVGAVWVRRSAAGQQDTQQSKISSVVFLVKGGVNLDDSFVAVGILVEDDVVQYLVASGPAHVDGGEVFLLAGEADLDALLRLDDLPREQLQRETDLQVVLDLWGVVLRVEVELVRLVQRRGAGEAPLDFVEVGVPPPRAVSHRDVAADALDGDGGLLEGGGVDDVVVEVGEFFEGGLGAEEVEALLEGEVEVLELGAEQVDHVLEIAQLPLLLDQLDELGGVFPAPHHEVDHHWLVEFLHFLHCELQQGLPPMQVQLALGDTGQLLPGLIVVELGLFSPIRAPGPVVVVGIDGGDEVPELHAFVERFEERRGQVLFEVTDHKKVTEVFLAAEQVLEIPQETQSLAAVEHDSQIILSVD